MARRYDSQTTTFSSEGRLYQVEYAIEAINSASTTLGIVASDGVVLAADTATVSKLLDQDKEKEKIYLLADHILCAVAGWTADANILVQHARLVAQQYLHSFSEPQPVEQLVVRISNTKQSYTQFGGLRPFGVSFLITGWDAYNGFQLYHTDPAGNYTGWKAMAIGQNNQSAQSMLRQEWKPSMTVKEVLCLAARVLIKTIDTLNPEPERLEFATVTLDPETQKPKQHILSFNDIKELIKEASEVQSNTDSTS